MKTKITITVLAAVCLSCAAFAVAVESGGKAPAKAANAGDGSQAQQRQGASLLFKGNTNQPAASSVSNTSEGGGGAGGNAGAGGSSSCANAELDAFLTQNKSTLQKMMDDFQWKETGSFWYFYLPHKKGEDKYHNILADTAAFNASCTDDVIFAAKGLGASYKTYDDLLAKAGAGFKDSWNKVAGLYSQSDNVVYECKANEVSLIAVSGHTWREGAYMSGNGGAPTYKFAYIKRCCPNAHGGTAGSTCVLQKNNAQPGTTETTRRDGDVRTPTTDNSGSRRGQSGTGSGSSRGGQSGTGSGSRGGQSGTGSRS